MNIPNRIAIEANAHKLRREELSRLTSRLTLRLTNKLANFIGNRLRRHHEAWLRNKEVKKVSASIGTPA